MSIVDAHRDNRLRPFRDHRRPHRPLWVARDEQCLQAPTATEDEGDLGDVVVGDVAVADVPRRPQLGAAPHRGDPVALQVHRLQPPEAAPVKTIDVPNLVVRKPNLLELRARP